MDGTSLLFLVFCCLTIGVILFNAAYDNLVWLLICLAIFCGITQFGFKYDILTYTRNNPGFVVLLVGVYLLLGIVYAIFRWWKFVRDAVVIRNKSFDRFIEWLKTKEEYKNHPFSGGTEKEKDDHIRKFLRDLTNGSKPQSSNSYERELATLYLDRFNDVEKPQISKHKDRFISWFMFWPFSAAVLVLKDLMREFLEAIYYFFARKLQSISDKIWND